MKAIKKPIPVEFIKLENTPQSIIGAYRFVHGEHSVKLTCEMAHDYWDRYSETISEQGYLPFSTLESGEGTQNANIGDYILKGIDGECWPVKPAIFERTYDIQPASSPESKEVESVPVKSAEEILIEIIKQIVGNHDRRVAALYNFTEVKKIANAYASQFKQPSNNEAVKVIEERIKELELLYLKTDLEFYEGDKACYEARIEAKIEEANYVLKLIQ